MSDDERKMKKRKEALKKDGCFTVNTLIERLQELKNKGYGDELVGSDFEIYRYCEYDDNFCKYVIVC